MLMVLHTYPASIIRSFHRDERGAVLVEFAISLPVMILFFAIMVETARTFWSYQLAISGVRDATRYMSRVLPLNSCDTIGGNDTIITSQITPVTDIVAKDFRWDPDTTPVAANVFPASVTVNSVTPTLDCDTSGDYRNGDVPVVTVTADLTIRFPLSFAWEFFGEGLSTGTAIISDNARVFGQ